MGFKLEMTFDAKAVLDSLEAIPTQLLGQVFAPALRAAAKPIVASAEAIALTLHHSGPGTGLTAESIDYVVRRYRKSRTVALIIGPANEVVGERFGRPHRPSKIAHLIERGHALRGRSETVMKRGKLRKVKGSGVLRGRVPGYPFMEPAWRQNESQTAQIIADVAAAKLQALAIKGSEKLAALEAGTI